MKILIVNADDFGYSYGVNKGIIEAHTEGIVTSTSVMVDAIAAGEAANLSKYPNLSVGIHLILNDSDDFEYEINRQTEKFKQITGRTPSHIDPHKSHSWAPGRRAEVAAFLKQQRILFRYSGDHNYINSYIASRTDGDVSIARLKKSLDEAVDGLNELMCHVGYADDYLMDHSSYNTYREQELQAISSNEIKEYIAQNNIQLVNWNNV